jgi:hypothetical protein
MLNACMHSCNPIPANATARQLSEHASAPVAMTHHWRLELPGELEEVVCVLLVVRPDEAGEELQVELEDLSVAEWRCGVRGWDEGVS